MALLWCLFVSLFSSALGSWNVVLQNPPWTGRHEYGVVSLPGTGIILMGGHDGQDNYFGDIWKSINNGANWTQIANWNSPLTVGGRAAFAHTVFGSNIFIAGGSKAGLFNYALNDVWSSADGVTWTQKAAGAAFGGRRGFCLVSLGSIMYIYGGYTGAQMPKTSYSSTDGITWTKVGNNAFSQGRTAGGCAVYDNKMWFIAGGVMGQPTAEVYWSTNAVTFTKSADQPFTPRRYPACASFNGELYCAGGTDNGHDGISQMYKTADGITWTLVNSGEFPGRSAANGIISSDNRFLMFGYVPAYPPWQFDNSIGSFA